MSTSSITAGLQSCDSGDPNPAWCPMAPRCTEPELPSSSQLSGAIRSTLAVRFLGREATQLGFRCWLIRFPHGSPQDEGSNASISWNMGDHASECKW